MNSKILATLVTLLAFVDSLGARIADGLVAVAMPLLELLPDSDAAIAHVRMEKAAYDRGQGNLIRLFLGVAVAFIVGAAVVIPIINDTISSTNFTNPMTETILGYTPEFIALLLLMAVAAPMMRRV